MVSDHLISQQNAHKWNFPLGARVRRSESVIMACHIRMTPETLYSLESSRRELSNDTWVSGAFLKWRPTVWVLFQVETL